MEKKKIGKYTLPFKLGLKSGYNGCNIYDANDEYVCGLPLLLHTTIQEIRENAKDNPERQEGLGVADYIVNACNSHAALLAACKLGLEYDKAIQDHASQGKSWVASDRLDQLYENWLNAIKSAIDKAGEA